MAWVAPEYSRSEINRAGKTLVQSRSEGEILEARSILGNWRAAHGYPLNALTMTLKNRAAEVGGRYFIAQRLKRLVSIENKLLRRPHERATQMQDIGGCRIVFESVDRLRLLRDLYMSRSSLVFQSHRIDDYIANPKNTGYRSLHLVYKYSSDKKPAWRNMRVELQIRSQRQHSWATAVEAASFFRQEDLKANEGDSDWLRYFLLMSHWISLREGATGVPGVATEKAVFLKELHELHDRLKIPDHLAGWRVSLDDIEHVPQLRNAWRYLIHLNVESRIVTTTRFDKNEERLAFLHYNQLEARHEGNPFHHIVLVSTDEVKKLKLAYPGFYADTSAFEREALAARKAQD